MASTLPAPDGMEIVPATADRWEDLATLLGPQGAFAGCWCAYWRLRHKDFQETDSAHHKSVLKTRTESDTPPGLLAYLEGEPIGWVSVEPRDHFDAFQYARVYKAVDETPVWTVTCFFIREDARGDGVTTHLLEAVKHHVRIQGGIAVEGYPEAPAEISSTVTPGYMGLVPAFEDAGFDPIAELSNRRTVYRADLSTIRSTD